MSRLYQYWSSASFPIKNERINISSYNQRICWKTPTILQWCQKEFTPLIGEKIFRTFRAVNFLFLTTVDRCSTPAHKWNHHISFACLIIQTTAKPARWRINFCCFCLKLPGNKVKHCVFITGICLQNSL